MITMSGSALLFRVAVPRMRMLLLAPGSPAATISTPPSCPCRASSIDVTGCTAAMSSMLIFWVANDIWRSVTPISFLLPLLPFTVTSLIWVAPLSIFTFRVVCPVYLKLLVFIPMYEARIFSLPALAGTCRVKLPSISVTAPLMYRFWAFTSTTLAPRIGSLLLPSISLTVPVITFCCALAWMAVRQSITMSSSSLVVVEI